MKKIIFKDKICNTTQNYMNESPVELLLLFILEDSTQD